MAILKSVKLILSDITNNNNKHWSGTILDNNEVVLEWGRVGDSTQKKVKPFNSQSGAENFLDDKVKEKKKKGYTELNTLSGTVTVNHDKSNLIDIAKKQIVGDDETKVLIERLSKANVHKILESTTLTFSNDTGLFATPLGIVTNASIIEARQTLNSMSSYVENKDFENPDYISLLNKYLRLIPQRVGRKLQPTIYADLTAIKAQNDIIDSLEVSYQQSIANPVNPNVDDIEAPKIFSCEIKSVNDQSIIDYINNKFKSTMQRMHSSSNLKVKKVYSVKIDKHYNDFEQYGRQIGNIMELWHGTKISNLLSILKSGLIIPPAGNPNVTGRMFGDGIYFSDQSTKALNYSNGYWSGNKENNCFMFLADVAMGKSYTPKTYGGRLPEPGYDSTFAKANVSSVSNNEMIVYKLYQANLKYLIEFDA